MKRIYEFAPETEASALKALKRRIEELDGVGFVKIDTKSHLLRLRFDPAEIEESEILASCKDVPLFKVVPKPHTARKRLFPMWLVALSVAYLFLAERLELYVPSLLTGLGGSIAQMLLFIALLLMGFDTLRLAFRKRHATSVLAVVICFVFSVVALLYNAKGGSYSLMFDSAALIAVLICTTMRFTSLRNRQLESRFEGITSSDFPAVRRIKRLSTFSTVFSILFAIGAFMYVQISSNATDRGVVAAVCVLVSACPNVPLLFTLSAYTNGRELLEKRGVKTAKPEYLQMLSRTDTLVMTADGILNRGVHSVCGCEAEEGTTSQQLLALAAAALQDKDDPVSGALVYEAMRQNIPLDPLIRTETDPENGVRALIGDTRVLVGSYEFMVKNAMNIDSWEEIHEARQNENCIDIYVATGGRIRGLIALASHLEPNVYAAFAGIKQMGIDIIVLPEGAKGVCTDEVKAAGASSVIEKEDTQFNLRLFKADKKHMLYLYAQDVCPQIFEGTVPRMSLGGDADAELDGSGLDIQGVHEALHSARRIRRTVRIYRHVWELYSVGTLVLSLLAGRLHIFPAQFILVNLLLGTFAMFASPLDAKHRVKIEKTKKTEKNTPQIAAKAAQDDSDTSQQAQTAVEADEDED